MSHSHGDGKTRSSRKRLAIAFGITASILIAEVIGALVTGSLALLVDAGHMLTDAAGLLMALIAASLALRPPSDRFTWGFRRAEVLAAVAQAAVLLAVGIYAFSEGISRLFDPPEVSPAGLLMFGIVGLVGNIVAILVLSAGRGANPNMRAASLEVVNDALGSVAVIVSAIVIATTGWAQIDALAAMLISILIVPRTLMLLKESGAILLESSPPRLDLAEVRRHVLELPADRNGAPRADGARRRAVRRLPRRPCAHHPRRSPAVRRGPLLHQRRAFGFQAEPTTHRDLEGSTHA